MGNISAMRLPRELQDAIDAEAAALDARAVAHAAREISERYQRGDFSAPPLRTAAHRIAYLRARMPATYAAVAHVFAEPCRRAPDLRIASVLDLGAGPGTAMWAATQRFPEIAKFTAIERDAALIDLGRRLAEHAPHPALRAAEWSSADLGRNLGGLSADLVVISYVLGELNENAAEQLVRAAWDAARKLLVIVEPGTPRSFQRVLAARSLLIALGDRETAQILAPCPHHNQCPLAAIGDWCHFAERVERTAEHRRLKGGSMGYEDEKFSYLAVSRVLSQWPQARIVRHPLFRPGHVQLTLCTADGLKHETIGKSQKDRYRAARKAAWGAAWNGGC